MVGRTARDGGDNGGIAGAKGHGCFGYGGA